MKHLFAVIFLFIVSSLSIYAQQEDTIKVKILPKTTLQFKDSLLRDKASLKLNPLHPDYNNMDKLYPVFDESRITFDFGKTNRKPNIFNASYSKFIIPTALISYGVITRGNKSLQQLDQSTHNEISEHLTVPIPIDDYSQFAPALTVYALDFAGIEAKHNFRDRTIVMATSYLIMGATVQTMKSSINVWRPDGSNNKSFPSGHTATAFVGAHILFKEYKDTSPWIGIAGYTVAAGTGTLRVLNKKHWVSDVVTGAGIGILSAEAGYMLLPVFHKVLGIKGENKNLVVVPTIGIDNYGLGMAYTF
ncbi:membrane-associated phospholipid phosphatase [Dysgonomonas hofstadii]|uniref:Membrane-associated phospholipid phosphatase n=1 Tax=Dysgonomonas hofstadii TaxID=637886 RepID=A0A840CSE9_9BACT|nr:phosphatase PAP2 family protein [Dysgonomonas hofstadii]MBB4035462.1 membrane-associated phospholipid phosphatase [Dysgonomonas hofstadii]